MTRTYADNLRALAHDNETSGYSLTAGALRDYADLWEAAAVLLRLKDGARDDAYRAAKEPAWQALRRAVEGEGAG